MLPGNMGRINVLGMVVCPPHAMLVALRLATFFAIVGL